MLRELTDKMKELLEGALLGDIYFPFWSEMLTIITMAFPKDSRAAFELIDARSIAQQLSESLPRHWETLCELHMWCKFCKSPKADEIISFTDIKRLYSQAEKFALDNRHEFRTLLYFLGSAKEAIRPAIAEVFEPLVRRASEPRDSEASSILRAFSKVDIERAQKISEEFAVEIQKTSEDERDGKESSLWEDFERRDESGEDYVIDLNGQKDDAE